MALGTKKIEKSLVGGVAVYLQENGGLYTALPARFTGNVTIDGTLTSGAEVIGAEVITSTSANAFAVGPAGTTNPSFNVDASTASAATGVNIKSAAAASGVSMTALSSGTNETFNVNAKGSGTLALQNVSTGTVYLGSNTTVHSSSAMALSAGPNDNTNPSFNVDASTASAATGLNIKSAAAGAGLAVSVLSSGTNENMTFNAKGSGTLLLGNISTGQVSIGRGSVKSPITSATITSLGTSQNTTPTAAQLVGGVITQTSATGAGTCTLDNGTNISTAVPGVTVGDTFQCVYANLGGAQTVTITGATGSTVVGNGAVASGKNAIMTFVNTGSNTWNVYVNVSA